MVVATTINCVVVSNYKPTWCGLEHGMATSVVRHIEQALEYCHNKTKHNLFCSAEFFLYCGAEFDSKVFVIEKYPIRF